MKHLLFNRIILCFFCYNLLFCPSISTALTCNELFHQNKIFKYVSLNNTPGLLKLETATEKDFSHQKEIEAAEILAKVLFRNGFYFVLTPNFLGRSVPGMDGVVIKSNGDISHNVSIKTFDNIYDIYRKSDEAFLKLSAYSRESKYWDKLGKQLKRDEAIKNFRKWLEKALDFYSVGSQRSEILFIHVKSDIYADYLSFIERDYASNPDPKLKDYIDLVKRQGRISTTKELLKLNESDWVFYKYTYKLDTHPNQVLMITDGRTFSLMNSKGSWTIEINSENSILPPF